MLQLITSVIYYKINPVHIFFRVLFLHDTFYRSTQQKIPYQFLGDEHCCRMNSADRVVALLSACFKEMMCHKGLITIHICYNCNNFMTFLITLELSQITFTAYCCYCCPLSKRRALSLVVCKELNCYLLTKLYLLRHQNVLLCNWIFSNLLCYLLQIRTKCPVPGWVIALLLSSRQQTKTISKCNVLSLILSSKNSM